MMPLCTTAARLGVLADASAPVPWLNGVRVGHGRRAVRNAGVRDAGGAFKVVGLHLPSNSATAVRARRSRRRRCTRLAACTATPQSHSRAHGRRCRPCTRMGTMLRVETAPTMPHIGKLL